MEVQEEQVFGEKRGAARRPYYAGEEQMLRIRKTSRNRREL